MPTNPAAGDNVVWEVRVRNQGLGNANSFRTVLVNAPDARCGISGERASATLVLGAGQAETVRLSTTVKAGKTYWLVVDYCHKVAETNENNNLFRWGQVR